MIALSTGRPIGTRAKKLGVRDAHGVSEYAAAHALDRLCGSMCKACYASTSTPADAFPGASKLDFGHSRGMTERVCVSVSQC